MNSSSGDTSERIHMIYVNGDNDFAELTRTKLKQLASRIKVTTAKDTRTALDYVAESSVDCLVTSYSLPDGTGIDLIEQIESKQPNLPTILFTGRGSEQIASEATQVGVSDYIPIHQDRDHFELLASRVQTLVDAERTEAAVERLSNRFKRTLERTTDAIYTVDDDWRIEYINEKMADRVNSDSERIVGNTIWEAFPSVVGTELEDRYRTAMETGEPATFDQWLGEPFNYWVDVRVFPDEDGMSVFSREITDERERKAQLERSEAALESVHDVVTVVDESGEITFANAAANRLLGDLQSTDLTGDKLRDVARNRIGDADTQALSRAVESTREEIETDGGLAGFYDADLQIDIAVGSSERTFDIQLAPFRQHRHTQVLVVAHDVTSQSNEKQQLRRERDALQQVRAAMAERDPSAASRIESLLEAGCRMLGLETGIVSRVQDRDYVVEFAHTSDPDIEVGDRFDLGSTYCETVVSTDGIQTFTDAASNNQETNPAYPESELESYIGVPINVDGSQYGTLNFSSRTVRSEPFGALEQTFVELLAELVSAELSRRRNRADFERQELFFDQVHNIADIGVWEYFPSRDDLRWSDGVYEIHGVDKEYEPSLNDAIEFYHPEDREVITNAVDAATEDSEPYDLSLRIVQSDGAVRNVRAWGEYVEDTDGGDAVLRGVIQDVTEKEEKQREFQELAEEYEALLETSGDAIFMLDVDADGDEPSFEFARLSPGYEEMTGLTTAEVRGETPQAVFGEDTGSELAANYTRCVKKGEPISYQEELDVGPDARYWETSLAPVIVENETVRIVGIARNVTERVERERDLEATNRRLESLIEATPLTVVEIDADGTIIRWNDEAEAMFGWSREEVLGERVMSSNAEQQGVFTKRWRRALRGERIRASEVQLETKTGDELEVLLSVAPILGPDGEVTSTLAVGEDITEQKRYEANLRALQETAQRLSGAESIEKIGSVAVEAAADVLDLDITALWEFDERTNALVPLTQTNEAVDLVGEAPRFTDGESLAWESFESGETYVYDDVQSMEGRYNPDTAIKSEVLVPLGEYGIMITGSASRREFSETDVDLFRILGATVEAALARASREEELHRQNKRLDEFAGVVAHDLRNPLTVAQGFLELAVESGDPEHFERVESALDRTERLVDNLLSLARGETVIEDPEPVDIESVTTEAWGYVDTNEASLTLDRPVPTVTGDPERLTQLFENLFRNAVEHGGRNITVTVGQLDDSGFYVEDDGAGVPPEIRGEVLEHGVTSSEDGTGLGLSIVDDIARAHDWTVSVTDGADGGARFEFAQSS